MIVADLVRVRDPDQDPTTYDPNNPDLAVSSDNHAAFGVELSVGQYFNETDRKEDRLVITVRQVRIAAGRWALEVRDNDGNLVVRVDPPPHRFPKLKAEDGAVPA